MNKHTLLCSSLVFASSLELPQLSSLKGAEVETRLHEAPVSSAGICLAGKVPIAARSAGAPVHFFAVCLVL
ncbi:hypothetical protein BDZ94DRAFT_1272416 [Collybia nuda]|uniref:Secreted protein n=1 Tax=Collybia nuda TaxID=64659 RepID=A0A9P5XVU3_9AGAR|nr:hypothetical protein BDZ94DRAFT_1272416 [Collybia nuda]